VQPLLQWKSNKCYIFWMCDCSLRYPACNAHAPCYYLWPAPLYNIFPHYLIKGTIFEKKNVIGNKKFVLIFSTTFAWNILHSKKSWTRCEEKCMLVFKYISYSCPVLMRFEFWKHSFEKYSNNKFQENLSNGSRFVPCGQTDGGMIRLDEAKSRFSQVRERTKKCTVNQKGSGCVIIDDSTSMLA